MFRIVNKCLEQRISFPRARGDVPRVQICLKSLVTFSPRTRGCSYFARGKCLRDCVFPAHAGMFRVWPSVSVDARSFPRARGDVPYQIEGGVKGNLFSPRTRGCSVWLSSCMHCMHVFPAHAGMFLTIAVAIFKIICFPRARGDVPHLELFIVRHFQFSPRTRGCSSYSTLAASRNVVFPAHAGMFRWYSGW